MTPRWNTDSPSLWATFLIWIQEMWDSLFREKKEDVEAAIDPVITLGIVKRLEGWIIVPAHSTEPRVRLVTAPASFFAEYCAAWKTYRVLEIKLLAFPSRYRKRRRSVKVVSLPENPPASPADWGEKFEALAQKEEITG